MDVLNALDPDRKEDCPSDLTLTLFETGSLGAEGRAEVEAHLAHCARCRSLLEGARADFEAWDPGGRAALLDELVQARAEPHRAPGRWGWAGGIVAAAAAALFFVAQPDPSPGTVRAKGDGLVLTVFRERGGEVSRVMSRDVFEAKDRLRFEVDLPRAGHVLVFGVEAGGAVYRAFPNDRDDAVPLPEGPGQLLPGAIELDASAGQEVLHLVLCPGPFKRADVTAGSTLALPRACRSTSFELDKRGR